MTVKKYRLGQWLLITGLISLLTIACGESLSSNSSTREIPASSSTQLVNHALGETHVPTDPQRVVVLHDTIILDPVIALGIKPIAATTYAFEAGIKFRGLTAEQSEGIEVLGSMEQPNLEKIAALKPDLIFATHHLHHQIYSQLSSIAPTVVVDHNQFDSFKDRFRYIAEVLGKGDQANQVLTQYQTRVEQLRQAMADQLNEVQVSVIHVYGEPLSTPDATHHISQIFSDIGLQRPPSQEGLLQEKNFSLEVLPEHDADVLFIVKYPSSEVETILRNPIWQQLNAVQTGQVYEVSPERWGGAGGPIVANRILGDLFQYLVTNPDG
ncbi:ABC transporter substrate-binding protein [Egbenema bharatensis]|uniref:ABC transporter substrate-binding protein n=1 Tax=Egbenema bharatensis TaxID=3463334 RepID=UPI003A863378